MILFRKVGILKGYFHFIMSLSIVLLVSSLANAAGNDHYYLQIASFRSENNANSYAETLRDEGRNPLVNGENIGDLGYWYRVYLGPYSTGREAESKEIEIKEEGLVDSAIIRKKNSLIPEKVTDTRTVVQGSLIRSKEVIVADAGVSLNEGGYRYGERPDPDDIMIVSSMVSAEQGRTPGTYDAFSAERAEVNRAKKDIERGKGRNIDKHTWGLGIKHIFFKVDTNLEKRQLLSSSSTTTTLTEIPVTAGISNSFPTSSHIDYLNIRYGLSKSFEVFGGIGISYHDNLSESGLSYGVGLRLNLFQTSDAWFYGAVQGEFIGGELKKEYKATSGERWGKEADFRYLDGKVEFGIARSNLNLYAGGSFLMYREDTERRLLENLPSSLVSAMYRDDLEEDNILGIFGGISYYLPPSLLLNIEGQYGNQNSGSVTIEYYF